MSEKMTDEDLEHELSQALSASRAAKVRAHLAALTAELAESRTSSDDYRHGCEELTRDRDTLRERVKALETDLDHSRKTGGASIVEARERAAAADRAVEVWRTECRAAESRLATIRQRAVDVSGFFRASGGVGAPGWLERGLGFVLGDDARPSAPPEAFTHEKGLDAGVFDDAPLNPDATGEADQPLPEGPLEPADMTDEESGRICADAGVDVESGVAKCLETVAAKRAEKPAPFRSEDEDPPEDVEERARDVYEAAIARREHQPAALALAVREALRLAPSGTVSASGPCGCGRPEAWTLEEVEQALRREELGPATARRVREHLAALRRRP
jgi:hypothetical protein